MKTRHAVAHEPLGDEVYEPFPHEGGCLACEREGLCNVCGTRSTAGTGRCTNGRCRECHATTCTSGERHGYGWPKKVALVILGSVLLAGCAASLPKACYGWKPTGIPAVEQKHHDWWVANCEARIGEGARGTFVPRDVPPLRFRYVFPSYPGGQGGLQTY